MNKINIPYIHTNNELKVACQNNLINCVMDNTIPFNWNYGLYGASLASNKILIKKMLELGANDLDWGFRGLCEKGDLDSIIEMEKMLASSKSTKINYDWALSGACVGNNVQAIKYFLSKDINDINSATRIIFENGNEELIDILINSSKKIDFSIALSGMCYGYRNKKDYSLKIIDRLLLDLDGNYFDCALYESSYLGLEHVVETIIKKANELKKKINLVHVIRGATLGIHFKILNKYINLEEEYKKIGYYEASYSNNTNLINWYENNFDLKDSKIYYLTGLCQSNNNKNCSGCLWCNKK